MGSVAGRIQARSTPRADGWGLRRRRGAAAVRCRCGCRGTPRPGCGCSARPCRCGVGCGGGSSGGARPGSDGRGEGLGAVARPVVGDHPYESDDAVGGQEGPGAAEEADRGGGLLNRRGPRCRPGGRSRRWRCAGRCSQPWLLCLHMPQSDIEDVLPAQTKPKKRHDQAALAPTNAAS